jgi:hypothetical protein
LIGEAIHLKGYAFYFCSLYAGDVYPRGVLWQSPPDMPHFFTFPGSGMPSNNADALSFRDKSLVNFIV